MFVNCILWPLRFGWVLVFSLYKEDIFKLRPFDYTAFTVRVKFGYP